MRRAWFAFLLFNFSVGALHAQQRLTTDVGVARLEQTGIPTSNAAVGGLTFDLFGERGWIRTSALAAIAGSDRATAQGLIVGSLFGPAINGARLELAASLSGFTETNDAPSTSADLFAGARFERGLSGAAFGIGGGAVGLRDKWSGILRGQGDTWWRSGADQVGLSVAIVDVPSAQQRVLNNGFATSVIAQTRAAYVDGTLSARHDGAAATLSASGGLRGMFDGSAGGGAWGSAEAAFWIDRRAAFVLGAGRSLDDVVRGVPHSTFVSAGLRFTSGPHAGAGTDVDRSPVSVIALGGGRHRLEIRGVDTAQLEVMGDFTEWKPVALTRDDGVWRVELTIPSGLHRLAMRTDGGAWAAPPGLPHADDGLGGTVGLITVP